MTPVSRPKRIAVIGAGIVGCATAYQLARDGHEVVLVDAAEGPALGTSLANGAQLSYSYVEPLASASTLRGLPKMLLDADSPLRLRLRADPQQWEWGLRFLAACTGAKARQGTESLLALARTSRRTLEDWLAREGWSFDFVRNGKLVLCPDGASLDHQRAQVDFQAAFGCRQEVLDPAACVAREPALSGYAGRFAGGVWTEDECVADPHRLSVALVDGLRAAGGETRFGSRVVGWRSVPGRLHAARTASADGAPDADIVADAFVLATGPAATAMGAALDLRLPIYPIKGYSLTLALRPDRPAPRISVTDLARKTVFAPLAGRLRVAAMAEIGGDDLSIPDDRVARILASVEAVFPGLAETDGPLQPWAGLRPATPTSVPITGRARRWDNLWLNVGHGALGLTLAAGSATVLAEKMRG